MALQSCATIFSSNLAETSLTANSSRLELRDSLGLEMSATRAINGDRIEYIFDLDKRVPYHDVFVHTDSTNCRVRFDRRLNPWWLIPNLLSYEVGSLVDLASENLYYFPNHTIEFSDRGSPPVVSKLDSLEQLEHKLLVSAFVGFLIPVAQNPITFTAWGASMSVQLKPAFWLGLCFSSGSYLKTSSGTPPKVYNTSANTIELYSQYYAIWGLFASAGVGAQQLTFQGSSTRNGFGFTDALWTFGFGGGINLHGFLLEWRRFLGLNTVDTPEEAGKAIRFDQFRIGFGIGLNLPSRH